jgi:hypothetical protein
MPVNEQTVSRDPAQETRTRRFVQTISVIINSLLQKRQIVQTGANTYSVTGTDQAILASQIFGP